VTKSAVPAIQHFADTYLKQVYVVYENSDERSIGTPAWYFTDLAKAEAAAKGRGWYGGDAPIRDRYVAYVGGGWAFLVVDEEPIRLDQGPDEQAAIKEAALKKLTPEEKQILGLE
jgi:hypothetical protein